MKSKTLVAFAVAIASALCSPGARAGDGYQLKTKIFIFKAADLPTATVSAGGAAVAPRTDGRWTVLPSPVLIRSGRQTIDVEGSSVAWDGVPDPSATFNLVSSPEVAMAPDKEATVTIGEKTQYLEKQPDGGFRLHEAAPGSPESAHCDLAISVSPEPGAPGELLVTCKPEIITVSGREKIEGVDLDVGKPVLSSHRDEVRFKARAGSWTCLLNQGPGGSDYGLLVMLDVDAGPGTAVAGPPAAAALESPARHEDNAGGDAIRVGVVVEVTDAGKAVTRPSPDKPAYYLPVVLGYREMGGMLNYWQRPPPPAEDVQRMLARRLASQGYLPAPAGAKPSLVLVSRWGVVDPENKPFFESKDSAADRIEPVNDDEMLGLVVGQPWYSIYPTYNPNARELIADLREKDSSRYFLIISAFDADAYANHRQVLLWRAHVTTLYWGHYLDQVLGTLIDTAAPLLGTATTQPRIITAPAAPIH